jgi:hypothetical protein
MEKDTFKTDVIFRKYPDGDIIALFPYEIQGFFGEQVICYMHIGQHGLGCYQSVLLDTKLATEEEYKELFNELENLIGYNLNVVKKRNSNKLSQALKELREKQL